MEQSRVTLKRMGGEPPARAADPMQTHASRNKAAILASAIGNTLEWYDFAVYGLLAKPLAEHFFPGHNPTVALLLAYAAFAVAFLVRPLGAVCFGHIGDRYGRKPALVLSSAAMALTTSLVGMLPTYERIGLAAPAALVVLRLVQGLSVGGEHATSAIVLAEQGGRARRGLFTSLAVVAVGMGTLLASGVDALLNSFLSSAAMHAWGWRVPFLLGIALGALALQLRRTTLVAESGRTDMHRWPVVDAFQNEARGLLRGFCLAMTPGVAFYTTFIYLPVWLQHVDGLSATLALRINTASMLAMMALTPLFGWASDRIGRKPVMTAALAGFIVFSWPLFRLLTTAELPLIVAGQMGLAVLNAAYSGAVLAAMVEMFRRPVRCSAMALSLNTGMGLIGGTAPIVAVLIVRDLHDTAGPAIYMMLIAFLTLIFGVRGLNASADSVGSGSADR
ncbi:MFS transporter [Burkholderia dolosa]|uniref:MFS transporter n=1 Tax=Burkholderia dolosa TaxID=152500 RepID=UPI001B9B65DD|nr:MFS transporter [Burkholderia dolosa]MBR8302401.1 MFS transporter [Burkholderia dolosa]